MKEQQCSLAELRRRIDDIDSELLALMNRRARTAKAIGSLKQGGRDFFRPEREAQVLRRLVALNDGPLSAEQVAFVFREIISACLALETHLRVGYPRTDGPAGERATAERFGRCVQRCPVDDTKALFLAVEAGEIDFGVVSAQPFTPTLAECFRSTPLTICAEGRIDATPGESIRYWVVGVQPPGPSGEDATTVLLELGDAGERIDDALGPFTRQGVDLSRIEAVPDGPGAPSRLVCVDACGHAADPPVAAALEELRAGTHLVRLLGSYPRGETEARR